MVNRFLEAIFVINGRLFQSLYNFRSRANTLSKTPLAHPKHIYTATVSHTLTLSSNSSAGFKVYVFSSHKTVSTTWNWINKGPYKWPQSKQIIFKKLIFVEFFLTAIFFDAFMEVTLVAILTFSLLEDLWAHISNSKIVTNYGTILVFSL